MKKLFDSLSARFAQKNGGYVRITRVGWRAGDGADMAMVELVGSELKEKAPAKKKKKEKA